MKLLAIDTATEACSAALLINGQCQQRFQAMPRGHTQALMPMVHALLAEAELSLKQLDGLAVGRGPGAFTGVRIGISAAQGLALGTGLPVVGVSSLAALAWLAGPGPVASIIDARAGGVYVGYFDVQGDHARPLIDECVCTPESIPMWPTSGDAQITGAGTGWAVAAESLQAAIGPTVRISDVRLPTATAIAHLAQPVFAARGACAAADLQPVYLRDQVVHKARPAK